MLLPHIWTYKAHTRISPTSRTPFYTSLPDRGTWTCVVFLAVFCGDWCVRASSLTFSCALRTKLVATSSAPPSGSSVLFTYIEVL